MSKFYPKRKSTDEIKELSIEDGSFIVNHETGEMYIDYEEKRILVGKGAPGYTPVKGKDYYTPEEKEEFIEDINSSIDIVTSKNKTSGETITINDALESKLLDLKIDGKSEQETTKGYQLFDASKIPTYSAGGATLTNNGDGSFTISGEGIVTSSFNKTYIYTHEETVKLLKPGKITIKAEQSTCPYIIYTLQNSSGVLLELNTYGTSTRTYTITEEMLADETTKLSIGFYAGVTQGQEISNGKTISPMVYQEGDGTFEEFSGGLPSPSPDYPSEIKSVGYTNLFDKDNAPIIDAFTQSSSGTIVTSVTSKLSYIECKPNTTYIAQKISGNKFCLSYSNQKPAIGTSFSGRVIDNTGTIITITTDNNAKYLIIEYYDRDNDEQAILNSIQIEESSIAHNYIPYNKYGIDVNVTGKNLFQLPEDLISNGITFTKHKDGSFDLKGTSTSQFNAYKWVPIKITGIENGETYTLSCNKILPSGVSILCEAYDGTTWKKALFNPLTNSNPKSTNIVELDGTDVRFGIRVNNGITVDLSDVKVQIEKGDIVTEYEPFKSNTTQLILNEPLRSLPNGIKDILCTENGKIFVERKVSRVVLNGSEAWERISTANGYRYELKITDMKMNKDAARVADILCNKFKAVTPEDTWFQIIGITNSQATQKIMICYEIDDVYLASQWIAWLSQNNVEVLYELAEPTIEEIGIVSSYTYDGTNNISIDGGLPTIFDIKYAQDVKVLLSDYYTKEEVDKLIADVKSLLETKTTNEEST